jgi:cytochrome c oxidase cbb3-type subunit 2
MTTFIGFNRMTRLTKRHANGGAPGSGAAYLDGMRKRELRKGKAMIGNAKALCAAAALACLAQSPGAAAEDGKSPWLLWASLHEKGENIYLKDCAACHGEKGNGAGIAAPFLDPKPRDFTTGMYKFRTTPSGELPSDADLMRTLEMGIPGTQMPPWKNVLTYPERVAVIAYIKSFSSDFQEAAPAPLEIPMAPAPTAQSVAEGKMVYMLMECWSCHGGKGRGDGKSGATLHDDWGRKILPWNLTRAQYKGGNDPRSLYRTFTTGLNGTPMPAYALDGFLIGGDVAVDPEKYAEAYNAADLDRLKAWLRTQPTESALQSMGAAQRQALGEKRKWALVHYIGSLVERPNFLVRMFTENTETTR